MNRLFYDKNIEVWKKGKQENQGGGVYVPGKPKFIYADQVDIQPYSSAQAKRDYGFDITVTHEMYSSKDDIEIGMYIIKYLDKDYEVKQKISWDTYTEYLLEMK